jgi:hypothetical protein
MSRSRSRSAEQNNKYNKNRRIKYANLSDKEKDEIRVKDRIRYKKRMPHVLLRLAKRRAMMKNIEINITIDDILIPNTCPVLGIPIIIGGIDEKKYFSDNSPTLDRIDNSKGYVKGNVCVISYRANAIKGAGSIEEHKKVVEYMERETGESHTDHAEVVPKK